MNVQFSIAASSGISVLLARRYPSTETRVSFPSSISNRVPVYTGLTSVSAIANIVSFIMLFSIFCGRDTLFNPSTFCISGYSALSMPIMSYLLLPHLTETLQSSAQSKETIPSGRRLSISFKNLASITTEPASSTSAAKVVNMPSLRSYPVTVTPAPALIKSPSRAGIGLFDAAALDAV